MHQVEGANPASPFLSLWCSPDNMPASHAGDHRSEAGQGRHFLCPQSILSDALLWYGNQLGAIPGGGSSFSGEWFSGNSRPHRSRICEPWRCKSSLAHQPSLATQERAKAAAPKHGVRRRAFPVAIASYGSAGQFFTESKPQQTGTGLLIRHGEVATTSGSTSLRPRRRSGRRLPRRST